MEDVWTHRDLPVLKAIVKIWDSGDDDCVEQWQIQRETGFDGVTLQRALKALKRGQFFEEGMEIASGDIWSVGPPSAEAYRLVGAWPTPENMVARLIAAFEAAANDDSLDEVERTRARKIWDGLMSGGSKIAIAALGSAGGHYLSSETA